MILLQVCERTFVGGVSGKHLFVQSILCSFENEPFSHTDYCVQELFGKDLHANFFWQDCF
jgi:hypothetical protein